MTQTMETPTLQNYSDTDSIISSKIKHEPIKITKNMTCKQVCDLVREFLSRPKVVADIIATLNREIVFCPIIRNIGRERDKGIIKVCTLKYSDLCKEDRNEISVYLGRILESIITCLLVDSGYGFEIEKDRTSSGDLTINLWIYEVKGTIKESGWTGSTHATKKESKLMNFIGVRYGIIDGVDVFDVLNNRSDLIDNIFIGVFHQVKMIRTGTASDNSSRTELRLDVEDYDVLKDQVAYGKLGFPGGSLYKKNGQKKSRRACSYLQLLFP